ncbi:hypothetical protein T265_04376 [Opisthorchis viverrini]|uniref:Uncharacterized protein n=1 Tax=Opisthorchis viverrini TaxID=6198 RepID=A0A075AGP2_OPIVI|nr:hypothetical protein T265_04376 [Opisthorchis viverrini]KER28919.1 hypothetical protein T265_04376 [Opisthorchis viverrini]
MAPKHADSRPSRMVVPSDWSLIEPITGEQVGRTIRLTGNSSPGLDKVTPKTLRRFNANVLAGARITLVPKVPHPTSPDQLRPISVSSILVRCFHKLPCHLKEDKRNEILPSYPNLDRSSRDAEVGFETRTSWSVCLSLHTRPFQAHAKSERHYIQESDKCGGGGGISEGANLLKIFREPRTGFALFGVHQVDAVPRDGLVQHHQLLGNITNERFSLVPCEFLTTPTLSPNNIRLTETRGLRLADEPQERRNRSWAVEEFPTTL